jgi:hypothetical protein
MQGMPASTIFTSHVSPLTFHISFAIFGARRIYNFVYLPLIASHLSAFVRLTVFTESSDKG